MKKIDVFRNPTRAAKRIFRVGFPGEEWPKGWTVEWADALPGAFGETVFVDKKIILCRESARGAVVAETLVHEFVHMLFGPGLPHGKNFERVVRMACLQVMEAFL